MEKLGIPTVTIVTSKFTQLATMSAEGLGTPRLCLVTVPHPIELIPQAQVEAKADTAFPDIIRAATKFEPETLSSQVKPYPAETLTFTGTVAEVNDFFFEKGWSVGAPVVPPTREQVSAMLKGTRRPPGEVVCTVPPRGGALTVELVAAHAVMAGAKPEFMPVILAIIDAMKDERYDLRATVTTSPVWPVVIVNGPVVKDTRIGYSTGAGGGECRANIAIGLTVNSIVDIVGGSKHPTPNMSIIGAAGEIIATVMGENEDELPEGWEPFHVEMGYQRTDSIVSVQMCRSFDMLGENGGRAEDMLWSFAKTAGYSKQPFDSSEIVVIIPPQAAALLAREGWTKDKVREYLWENARSPVSWWRRGYPKEAAILAKETAGFAEKYGPITPDTLIPVVDQPEKFKIFVIGGPGTHSFYYKGCHGRMVTRLVER